MYRDKGDFSVASISARAERVHTRPRREISLGGRTAKRAMDILGALVFFTLLLPLFLAVALGVAFTSRGPISYSQSRLGHRGRNFNFYKFRSMVVNADRALALHLAQNETARAQWDNFQKLDNDPRITRFGRFIRRTSLDELPQFWNVLKGDMSLVGPRPCMPQQRELYGQHWATYCAVKPGITGLWQVSGRNNLTYRERVALDAQYVLNWSIGADLKILLKTVAVVLGAHGAH